MSKDVTKDTGGKTSLLKFLISLVAAVMMVFVLKDPSFTDSQVYVVFLLFFSIGLWFTEAIPAFAVGLFIMAFLVFTLGNKNFNSSPENIDPYVNTFSSSIIWLMLGGFFLSSAMTKTRLDVSLFRFTLKVSGTNPRNLLIGLMMTTMIASMLLSNTVTTAMVVASLLPFLNSLDKKSGIAKALLIGVAIAASTGGMATIIGTPPNLIAVGELEEVGINLEFLDWMIYGFPISVALTALACFVLIKVYLKDNTPIVYDFNKQARFTAELKLQRRIVVVIIFVTLLLWLTNSIHGISVSAVSAVPIVFLPLAGIINGNDVKGLPWDTLLLVAGGLSLGLALQHTGLLSYYADQLLRFNLGSTVLLFFFAYLTMLFSNVMSNSATSTVLIPLGMSILTDFKIEIALIVGLSASTALFLPVSTPPNAIVFGTGLVQQKDFRLGGLLIGLLGPAIAIGWVLFIRSI